MGKTIVITGAGGGLGRAIARRFAADGETVVLLGRTLSKVQAVADEIGGAAHAFGCDVASPESVKAAFAQVAERFGQIDVLINNAAVYEPFLVAEARDDQILSAISINVTGPILCARSAIPLLRRGGHLINISSESVVVPFPFLTVYQTTKAAVERFSQALVAELEPNGISVTNVRAGQMMDQDSSNDWDPEVRQRFGAAAMQAGLNLRERPITHFNSVTDVFSAIINLPPDLQIGAVNLSGRKREG